MISMAQNIWDKTYDFYGTKYHNICIFWRSTYIRCILWHMIYIWVFCSNDLWHAPIYYTFCGIFSYILYFLWNCVIT